MQKRFGRIAGIGRVMAIALVALAISTPASAQFGGLKKKLKGAAAQEGANKAGESAGVPAETEPTAAPGGQGGGTIVLTEDVVARLLAGLKAGKAEREAAETDDTPYGRHKKAEAAFAAAEAKCRAAQQSFPQRMVADEKMRDKYSALVDKMVAAQTKGDQKLTKIYQDSAMAMQDPSCTVERPGSPGDDYYQAQREIDGRAEKQEIKASGFSRSELAMVKERTDAILRKAAPDASASEKSAVDAKSGELRPLMGFRDEAPAPAAKPAPAPAPAAPAAPAPSPAVSSMNECMMKNMQDHQKEIEALGKRAEAAHKAGDQARMMAIADTLQQIQMAGCR